MGIGNVRGKAVDKASDGGNFSRSDHAWLAQGQGFAAGPTSTEPKGFEATGGFVSEYTDSQDGEVYRAHIFNTSGTFDITSPGEYDPLGIDYMIIGGGGAGGNLSATQSQTATGGGGAGSLHYKTGVAVPGTYPAPYPVVVGGGGYCSDVPGNRPGSPSTFNSVTAQGGGGGGQRSGPAPSPSATGMSGGCGGGGSSYNGTGSEPLGPGPAGSNTSSSHTGGINETTPGPASGGWAHAGGSGGDGQPEYNGAGGAGIYDAGADGSNSINTRAPGGSGARYTIANGTAAYYAGGGGGGSGGPTGGEAAAGLGGNGGGGKGGYFTGNGLGDQVQGVPGGVGTGGGGGGCGGYNPSPPSGFAGAGGNGGSGVVVVRYKIGAKKSTKCTGGLIQHYGSKTIHIFNSSGTFVNDTPAPLNCEVVVIAGGGGGGYQNAGGGGAGGYLINPSFTVAPSSPLTVTVGGGGNKSIWPGQYPVNAAQKGFNSAFGPQIATGGGAGGSEGTSGSPSFAAQGGPGGSGGGSGRKAGPDHGDGTPTQGHDGGEGGDNPYGGGGGGGAGAIGTNVRPGSRGGHGGAGVQLPSSFQIPTMASPAPSPNALGGLGYPGPEGAPSGSFWVCGGGGGGSNQAADPLGNGGCPSGSPGVLGSCGAGMGQAPGPMPEPQQRDIVDAKENSGSGGGGGGEIVGDLAVGGIGGSGLVLVAYPS